MTGAYGNNTNTRTPKRRRVWRCVDVDKLRLCNVIRLPCLMERFVLFIFLTNLDFLPAVLDKTLIWLHCSVDPVIFARSVGQVLWKKKEKNAEVSREERKKIQNSPDPDKTSPVLSGSARLKR